MRSYQRVMEEMLRAAQASEPDVYPLRLLKAELLTVELLLDIRELLQGLQPPTIMAATEVESHGRDEGLRSQNHIHP